MSWPSSRQGRPTSPCCLAAIDAVASIRPQEAPLILGDLAASGDDDIVAAVDEAMAVAGGLADEEDGELDADAVLH